MATDARKAQREAEVRTLQQAVARLEEQLATKPEDLRLLDLRAKAAERLEAWEDAANYWQRLVKAARAFGERSTEARACLQAGVCLSRAERPNKGVGFLQRAVAAFELLRDEPSTARARIEQARHHASQGDDARARPLLELAIPALEAVEAWDEVGWACRELSRIAVETAGPEAGLEPARQAVEATAKAKDGPALGERLAHLASLHHATGSTSKARGYYERALPYLRPYRASHRLLAAYQALVAIARAERDPASEERWLTEAIFCVDLTNNLSAQGRLRVELAAVIAARAAGRARGLVQSAIDRLQRGGDPQGTATAYTQLGKLLAAEDRDAARSAWSRAIEYFRMIGDDAAVVELNALSEGVGA
jgi:tetratricopeptide (TPR) repeat protein